MKRTSRKRQALALAIADARHVLAAAQLLAEVEPVESRRLLQALARELLTITR